MIVILLIAHALLAVTLLGAITHQTIGAWLPARQRAESFVGRMRSVPPAAYANAVVVLYVATATVGAVIYPSYRLNVRLVLEQMQLYAANGSFELKEHFVTLGLGVLPAYWYFWRKAPADHARTRAALTALLAFVVWWSFIVGHVLNNIRGFEI
jgi:hypothetical protein